MEKLHHVTKNHLNATFYNHKLFNPVAIVKYSVAPHADFIQLKQGLEVVEELSKTYEKIVVCGFSAGGHLAGLVATEKAKNNIKAMILCYPVITLCDKTHLGTRTNLLAKAMIH